MRGMLVNESVYMPVNHFILPFQYQGKEAVSEFWIDPDAEKKKKRKMEAGKYAFWWTLRSGGGRFPASGRSPGS